MATSKQGHPSWTTLPLMESTFEIPIMHHQCVYQHEHLCGQATLFNELDVSEANAMVSEGVSKFMSHFQDTIDALEIYENLLVEYDGYVAKMYGEWHIPLQTV